MALTSEFTIKTACELTSVLDLATVSVPLTVTNKVRLANGTGANQADLIFHDTRTLAASGTEDLDLAGVLVSALGSTLTFARVKAVVVSAAAGNTNSVHVTRAAINGVPLFLAAGDGVAVRPGGVFAWVAPDATAVAVTAGTGDLLTVANSAAGTPVTYNIVIVGASA